ncbi:MAG: hypothetical protein ABI797_07115, partial [Chloroflexota bacterium]
GLKHSYDPVLDIYPTTWDAGTFRIEFDVMAQPGADWFFEIRGKGGDFGNGPYLRWQDSKFVPGLSGKAVPFDVPPNEWMHVTLTATTRTATTPAKTGTWTVSLTRQDGEKKGYLTFGAKPTWTSASYMLFSALGTTKTAFFIDNLKLEQVAP